MNTPRWEDELALLLEKVPGLGAEYDVASMTKCELWGLYCLLKRLAEGQKP